MNVQLLRKKLQEAKYQDKIKDKDFAAAMNISKQAFSLKKQGKSNFTSKQQCIITRMLKLSEKEAFDIFLANEGDENGNS